MPNVKPYGELRMRWAALKGLLKLLYYRKFEAMKFNENAPQVKDIENIAHALIEQAVREVQNQTEDIHEAETICGQSGLSIYVKYDVHVKLHEWEPYQGRGHTLTDITGIDVYVHEASLVRDDNGLDIADVTNIIQEKLDKNV